MANRSILGLARTFTHEVIHAEMYRKVRSVNNNISINDFPGIYDYYRRYLKNWQHQQMAQHYIATIADILQTFDGNKNTRQYYEDISWVGLYRLRDKNNPGPDSNPNYIYSEAWKSLTIAQQNRIKVNISNSENNQTKVCNP